MSSPSIEVPALVPMTFRLNGFPVHGEMAMMILRIEEMYRGSAKMVTTERSGFREEMSGIRKFYLSPLYANFLEESNLRHASGPQSDRPGRKL